MTVVLTRVYLQLMLNSIITLLISVAMTAPGLGAQVQQNPRGMVIASEFNVKVESDARMFVVMAAINAAGFDYEPGGQPLTPARAELRRDLAHIDPALKAKLASFYRSHRRQGTDEAVDALRYSALSLLMAAPPSFEVYVPQEQIPDDLRPLLVGAGSENFVQLVREFYLRGGIKDLLPKYLAGADQLAAIYRQIAGETLYEVLNYFHAKPQTLINMRPLVIESGDAGEKGGKKKQKIVTRNRTRQVFVLVDPLAGYGTSFARDDLLNQKDDLLTRKVGDEYIAVIGPSKNANIDTTRQALIRFVIDPIVEQHLKSSLKYKDMVVKLVAGVPTAAKEFGPSVYLVIRESLARAAETRLRRIEASTLSQKPYTDDDATFDLAQAYLHGAVLAFHFYDSLIGLEKVGISIEDFLDEMVATANYDKEATRPKQFEPVVARVSEARRVAASKMSTAGASLNPIADRILRSDDLIRQRRFVEAKPLLEEILAIEPNNARALFGMARVLDQVPSAVEKDPQADENDKIHAQHERFKQALKLYEKTIAAASADTERRIVQWCHVLMGRILDFQELRNDAIAEYEKAIAMGDLPDGAYKEALLGKQRPYGRN